MIRCNLLLKVILVCYRRQDNIPIKQTAWVEINTHLFTKRAVVCLAEEAAWRRNLWYYQHHSVMKSMKVSSSSGGCDLCQPWVPGKGNTWACLHNGSGFVGVLKWHFTVVLGEHRAGNSSWMTHCYSIPWHGLHNTSTLMVIAAIFFWLMVYPSTLLILLSFSSSTFSPCFFSPSSLYPLLRRPQAGDDLRLLADGLAGELLQYCHDHQAGGGGQGRFLFSLSCDLSSPCEDGWRECISVASFTIYYTVYQKSCCTLCCGRKWLPPSDREWSPFALVDFPQGQSFDICGGPWRNYIAHFLLAFPATVAYNSQNVYY